MSLDMADEEDGKDDYFLEMSHCGLGSQSGVKDQQLKTNITITKRNIDIKNFQATYHEEHEEERRTREDG